MTKKELLDMLDGSTLKYDVDKKGQILYDKYYKLIAATLKYFPDVELTGFSSLDGIKNNAAFEQFLRSNSVEAIEDKFKEILTDLNTFANVYSRKNPDETRNTTSAIAIYTDWLERRQRRNHKIIFPIFISLFIVFAAVVALFALLEIFEMVDCGGKISAVAGILDFINGVAFFVYEQLDDRKKEQIKIDFGSISHSTVISDKNKYKFKGNNNNFGIECGGSSSNKSNKLEQFILQYGNKYKFKGDNNNFGKSKK